MPAELSLLQRIAKYVGKSLLCGLENDAPRENCTKADRLAVGATRGGTAVRSLGASPN